MLFLILPSHKMKQTNKKKQPQIKPTTKKKKKKTNDFTWAANPNLASQRLFHLERLIGKPSIPLIEIYLFTTYVYGTEEDGIEEKVRQRRKKPSN